MVNSNYIKRVVVEHWNGELEEILDKYIINQIHGLLSCVGADQVAEINDLLNEESRNETK